jgi:adenosylcobinamide-GDP ribazoletransferase
MPPMGLDAARRAIRREIRIFWAAVRFFTRIPAPRRIAHDEQELNRAARHFPLIGLVVGLVAGFAGWLAGFFWPKSLVVLLALAASIWLTGAFHEDGLSDTADGFGGGWEKMRILEIMKDSRVGVFGVVVLTLSLLGRYFALLELPHDEFIAAFCAGHVFSRFCSTLMIARLPYVREDALTKAKPVTGALRGVDLAVAGGTTAGILSLLLFWLPLSRLLCGVLLGAIVTFGLARFFRRWIGGMTGDCLGATQQAAELAFYLGLLAFVAPMIPLARAWA